MLLLLLLACESKVELTPLPEEDLSGTLFSRDALLEIDIELDEDDWDTLRHETRDLVDMLEGTCLDEPFDDPYDWVHAAVTVDGESFTDVGLRKKGLIGSADTEKPGLKVRFDKYEEGLELRGLTRLTLNNVPQDPTQMRTCLAYDTFLAMGLPAPRCSFAHVTVNGEDLGAYVHVEAVDEAFLTRHYGDDSGRLWEGTLSDFRSDWVGTFDPKTHEDDVDRSALYAVAAVLEDADDDELVAELEPLVDVDAFARFWATEAFVGHWDGYAGNTNNFFVYEDPADGRMRFSPWGADATFDSRTPFGQGSSVATVALSALPVRLSGTAEGRDAYEAALTDVVAAWDEDAALAEIERMRGLLSPFHDLGWRGDVSDLQAIVEARGDDVADELDDGLAWSPYLRDYPCLVGHGSVEATFSTTWGSYGREDYFTAGEGTLSITWDDAEIPIDSVGVVAGEVDDETAILLLLGTYADQAWLAPYVVFDLEEVRPGEVEVVGTNAVLLYADASTDWQWVQAAYLGSGALVLEEAGTTLGDALSGTLSGELLGGE